MAALASAGPVPIEALALIAFPASWDEKMPSAFESLRDYRGPVLAVCGEDDDIAPPGPLERFLSGMGLDFRLDVLPGAGHLFEESRKEVGRLVAEFMAEALGRRRPTH
jgi:pimeloyl-ACP methyl ester carboxylesterase